MRVGAAVLFVGAVVGFVVSPAGAGGQEVLVFPGANSRETWFSVHNLGAAQEAARGRGVKVGILDHSFGLDVLPELYAGGENFQDGPWGEAYRTQAHHGSWMARALKEVAPEAEVYALGTYHSDEAKRVDAMVRALAWAAEHGLDVVTYSAGAFSPDARRTLDPAVEQAVARGVTVIFIHYPHPLNLFPSWIGPRTGDDQREPDVNIYQYDYTVLFADRYAALERGEDARGYRPFLSLSSTAPVTAGIVAMMKEVNRALTPADCKEILQAAGRPFTHQGMTGARTPDAAKAVEMARGWPPSRRIP